MTSKWIKGGEAAWKAGKSAWKTLTSKKSPTIKSVDASVGKSELHKDMAKSKISMMKQMGSFQKKVGIDKYKEKGGPKIYKKILKIDPGNP